MIGYRRHAAIRRNNKQIASERISILLTLAREKIKEEPNLAQRYVKLAREIGMHYKVRIPLEYRRIICRNCKQIIIPGINCRTRTRTGRESHVVITCLICGGQTRIPLKERKAVDNAKAKIKN
ncbi:MAG: ribonuclease protein subunit [Thermoproteota archaeon]|nr:ribonuclease protein subunit [Thermoproteota archaeon]